MRDPQVDAQLFRLRAFKSSWAKRLLSARGRELTRVLAAEGEHWQQLGARIGFFPAIQSDLTTRRRAASVLDEHLNGLQLDAVPSEFAFRVAEASEDLTPARIAYLELLVDPDEERWQRELDLAYAVAEMADAGDPRSIEALDQLAWLLEGAHSEIDSTLPLPAFWRSDDVEWMAMIWPRSQDRYVAASAASEVLTQTAARVAEWTLELASPSWPSPRSQSDLRPDPVYPWGSIEARSFPWLATKAVEQTRGSFTFEPLQRGFGYTLGNSLRRVLLSSLPGVAVTSVRIEGATPASDTPPGARENVNDIVRNLQAITWRMHSDATEIEAPLVVTGPGDITAKDIDLPSGVEILNPDAHIATLEKKTKLEVYLTIGRGRGYRPAEENKSPDQPIGVIPIDSIFSPVRSVAYAVEQARVGQKTDFDKLTLDIETDGSIDPHAALREAAEILISQLAIFTDADRVIDISVPVRDPAVTPSDASASQIPWSREIREGRPARGAPTAVVAAWRFDRSVSEQRVMERLQGLQRDGVIRTSNVVTVQWERDATRPRIRSVTDIGDAGGLAAFWGLLFGLTFFAPQLDVGDLGRFGSGDIEYDFIASLRDEIQPGTWALFVVASAPTVIRIDKALAGSDAHLIQTTLSARQFGGTFIE